jgi:hypothetical protein
MGWSPPASTASEVGDWITSAWGTACTDCLRWLLSASDTWNTSGIAQGNGLAASGRPGLLSAADWDTFNGKLSSIADAAITQAKLSTTTASSSTTNDTTGVIIIPANSDYAWLPRYKTSNATYKALSNGNSVNLPYTNSTSYTIILALRTEAGIATAHAEIRYVQSSPPYPLGDVPEWGPAWLYLHRRKADGAILSACWTEDPPHEGHWTAIPKGHPARLAQFPHPFADFWTAPLPPGEEIVLVDLSALAVDLTPETAPARALRIMRAQAADFAARGIPPADLLAFERRAEEAVALAAPVKVPAHRAILATTEALGSGPLAIVHGELNGLGDPALEAAAAVLRQAGQADRDLPAPDRQRLPRLTLGTGKTWAQTVRVVRL